MFTLTGYDELQPLTKRGKNAFGGLGATALPAAAIGYLYLPAFAGMTLGAVAGSPLGVRISHHMREAVQFRLFLAYLSAVLISMMVPG